MNDRPRIPHGVAKRIVASMRVGETVRIRDEYADTFRETARRLAVHLSIKPLGFRVGLSQMKRVEPVQIFGFPVIAVPSGVLPSGATLFGDPTKPKQCAILKQSA